MMKKCKICGEEKSIDDFYMAGNYKGKQYYRGECINCSNEVKREYRIKNQEKIKTLKSIYYLKNKEEISIRRRNYFKKYRVENRDKLSLSNKQWYEKNKERHKNLRQTWNKNNIERNRLTRNLWAKKNRPKGNIKIAKRKAAKLQAIPTWSLIDEFNQFVIEETYHLAKLRTETTGIKYHVDHIVPLRSKLVCGLHIWNNFQVIPAIDNIKKGNRVWPDMP